MKLQDKSALIPYIIENNKIYFLFMRPSDFNYGGPRFQIAKGGIEDNESHEKAALREAKEELGISIKNILRLTKLNTYSIKVKEGTHLMHVFICNMRSKETGQHDNETKETKWMQLGEFEKRGRKNHVDIVRGAYNLINKKFITKE